MTRPDAMNSYSWRLQRELMRHVHLETILDMRYEVEGVGGNPSLRVRVCGGGGEVSEVDPGRKPAGLF